jgi:ribosomal protein S18 acetylase RimI-like enzyme
MIHLVPMTAAEYADYMKRAVPNYAEEQVRAGSWPAKEADERARQAFDALLPEGKDTPNQSLNMLVDEESEERVGILWYGIRDEAAGRFVALFDFEVFEAQRRCGYGTQALEALEEAAAALGIARIALHVFGHNAPARALYRKAGFTETHVTMAKDLSS